MGEHQKRKEFEDKMQLVSDLVASYFADRGLLIEAGWAGLALAWLPDDLSTKSDQYRDLRWAFFAGAQHLFASFMGIMDPGEEPTDKDIKKMDLLAEELKRFQKHEVDPIAAMHMKTKGSA